MNLDQSTEIELGDDMVPQCGRGLMLWTSRHYVNSLVDDEPLPDVVHRVLESPLRRRMLDAIKSVWDLLVTATEERYVLHRPWCNDLSIHEQAVMMELNCLQGPNKSSFGAAMSSVLPPSAVRRIKPRMKALARYVYLVDEAQRLRKEREYQRIIFDSARVPAGARLH